MLEMEIAFCFISHCSYIYMPPVMGAVVAVKKQTRGSVILRTTCITKADKQSTVGTVPKNIIFVLNVLFNFCTWKIYDSSTLQVYIHVGNRNLVRF